MGINETINKLWRLNHKNLSNIAYLQSLVYSYFFLGLSRSYFAPNKKEKLGKKILKFVKSKSS